MTTEDDFQAALDAHPEDWQTRLVFADWLQERGDVRAEGYRALGVLRRSPIKWGKNKWCYSWLTDDNWRDSKACTVPIVFGSDFTYYPKSYTLNREWVSRFATPVGESGWAPPDRDTRRAAEDEAARAFADIPDAGRAELLSLTP